MKAAFDLSQEKDQQLVIKAVNGKLSAFEILVQRYQKQIYSHTLRLLKDQDAAEDATQETFIRAFKNLNSFKGSYKKRSFKSYLYQIATNFCFDYLRKNSRLVQLSEQISFDEPSALEKIIKKERAVQLRKALKKLAEAYRKPLIGYYFYNLNYQTLSITLDLPLNTVRSRIRRGKLLLAKLLVNKV
jgi:RNA polymerase sigma-70 factor (ECF subfamily)